MTKNCKCSCWVARQCSFGLYVRGRGTLLLRQPRLWHSAGSPLPDALVSWGCGNQVPYTWWLEQQKLILSQFWRLKLKSVSQSLSCVRLFATPWTGATRLLRPWDSPGKNTGVGCHSLLQGSSQPKDGNQDSCIAGRFFTV